MEHTDEGGANQASRGLDLALARRRYANKRSSSKQRGIPFHFTFEEWLAWWMATGCYDRYSEFCMARHGDAGPYAVDNITCKSMAANGLESGLRGAAHLWSAADDALLLEAAPGWDAAALATGRSAAACLGRHQRLTTKSKRTQRGFNGDERRAALTVERGFA